MRTRRLATGIAAIVLIFTSLILVWQERPTIYDEILRGKARIEDSAKAVKTGDINAAETYLLDARSSLKKVKRLLIEKENELKGEVENFKIALQMYEDIYKILAKIHFLSKEAIALQNTVENVPNSEALLLLPRMEVIGRGLLESEMYLKTTMSKLDLILKLHPDVVKYGLNDEFKGEVEDLTPWFLNFRHNFQKRFATILSMFPNYKSLNLREVPTTGKITPSHPNANVLLFFDALDEDNSKTLNFEELQNLFYWSKWKIDYTPDGKENQIMKVLADPDYWETPAQMRIKIFANDKDLSVLYVTFLSYYGVDAHVASLFSNSKKAQDHFVSIVRFSEIFEEFNEKIGSMPFFALGGDKFGVSPGFYIILDPLSDAPFYLVGGESPAEFTINRILQPNSE